MNVESAIEKLQRIIKEKECKIVSIDGGRTKQNF
jgi:hypothetical protein